MKNLQRENRVSDLLISSTNEQSFDLTEKQSEHIN